MTCRNPQTIIPSAPRGGRARQSLAAFILCSATVLPTAAASGQGALDDTTVERLVSDPTFRDAQVLVDWNELGNAKSLEVDGFQTLKTNRAMPLMHLAVHDALNAIAPVYMTYGEARIATDAHPVAAVSQVAHDVLAEEYPDHADAFAELHAQWLDEVPDGSAKERGRELGAATAAAIIAARAGDRHDSEGSFSARDAPGAYRVTPPNEAPVGTGWADTEPLGMETPDQFRPGPPPELTAARYAEEFEEVKRLGVKDSTERTDVQTHVAYWWAEYTTIGYPDFVRTRVAEEDIHLWSAARLFALLAIDNFDALISGWDAKYTYEYWRPVTAIHDADADGNDRTTADPDWEPEMTTPPHPDYPAALSLLCAGGAEILKDFFGSDVAFTRESGSVPDGMPATRSYESIDAAVESCGMSRIYNGFHFRSGVEIGTEMGRDRAQYILDTHLVRRPEADGMDLAE
jgi:hypothetical protein